MKKIIFILLSVFSLTVWGQNQQLIGGIGKIRLEMSLMEAKRAFPNMLIPVKSDSKFKKIYRINSYTPIKNHTLKDIRLYFYNDTLYTFYINKTPAILKYSLIDKYGKPKEKIREFYHQYIEAHAVYGEEIMDFFDNEINNDKKDVTDIFYEWNEGYPIAQCFLIQRLYTNKKNEREMEIVFSMKNKLISRIIELKEKLLEEENKEQKQKELEKL